MELLKRFLQQEALNQDIPTNLNKTLLFQNKETLIMSRIFRIHSNKRTILINQDNKEEDLIPNTRFWWVKEKKWLIIHFPINRSSIKKILWESIGNLEGHLNRRKNGIKIHLFLKTVKIPKIQCEIDKTVNKSC